MEQSRIRPYIYMALFAALMSSTALFSLYVYTIPFTLQTFFVCLAAVFLSKREAFGSMALYVLIGGLGLPVFAGGKAGISALLGPTGGFIIGFIFAALIGAIVFELASKGERKGASALIPYVLAALVAIFVVYAFGCAWFMYSASMPLIPALMATVVPFIPADLAKAAVAIVFAISLKRILAKSEKGAE